MATTLDQPTQPDQPATDRPAPPDRLPRNLAGSAASRVASFEMQIVHLIAWLATSLWRATEFVPRYTAHVTVLAVVIAALFLTDTALGFVARAVPQMNVFVVGFPVKIAAGLLLLFATAPLLATLMSHYTKALEGQLLAVLAGM